MLGLPLSSGITEAVLAFSGKTFCVIQVLKVFVSNGVKKSAESFTSLGGIKQSQTVKTVYVPYLRRFTVSWLFYDF